MKAILGLLFGLLAPPLADRATAPAAVLAQTTALIEREYYDQAWAKTVMSVALPVAEAAVARGASAGEAIRPLLAAFGTSHTSLLTRDTTAWAEVLDIYRPEEPATFLRARFGGDGTVHYVGVGMRYHPSGRPELVDVYPGAPAFEAGLRAGDRIVGVSDGLTPADLARDLATVRRAGGDPMAPLEIYFRRPGVEAVRTATATPTRIQPTALYREALRRSTQLYRAHGVAVAYTRIRSLGIGTYCRDLRTYLVQPELREANALIVDLRGGWGGWPVCYARILANDWARKTWNGEPAILMKPIVVIADEGSRSAKEVLAGVLQEHGAPVIGQTTAGAVLPSRGWILANGDMLVLPVERRAFLDPPLEGRGLPPDIPLTDDELRDPGPLRIALGMAHWYATERLGP